MPSRKASPNRSETFGRLLSGAINSIATYEGKTAPIVEEELGRQMHLAGKTIQRYKAGHLPPEGRAVEVLAEAAVQRGYLGREWLGRFLHAARYPFADKLLDRLCPLGPARPRPPRVYHNLPAPTYSQFVMRAQAFAEVLDGLQQRSAVVLIVGLGGNGKTSLAREVAARCLREDSDVPRFDAVVWVSDKDRPGTTNLSLVLDEIARTLDYPGFTQFAHDEKAYEVGQLLKRQRVLVVVDNFETLTDGALLSWLLRLPEPSKALITSREYARAFRNSTIVVDLRGMSETEAKEFIDQRLHMLRIAQLVSDQAWLEALMVATGGNPKAIEIALGLVKHERRPIQQVVDDLYAARGELFDDLFNRAWALLDEAARRVALVMTFFPTNTSGGALAATADVQGFAFDRAVERLIDLALLDVQQADLNSEPRYGLHPLVRAFAYNNMLKMEELDQQARSRWAKYFVDLVRYNIVRDNPKEPYWNALISTGMNRIDVEQENLLSVLEWVNSESRYSLLIELTMLLAHYMDRRVFLYPYRSYYARKAAEAACLLRQRGNESMLRIDALGWLLIEDGELDEAEREIEMGLSLARMLGKNNTEANDLIALGQTFLARVHLHRGHLVEARTLIDTIVCQYGKGSRYALNGLVEAQTMIEPLLYIQCCMPVWSRVTWIAGEIYLAIGEFDQALGFYQESERASQEYGGEWVRDLDPDVGFIYLARGDLEQAARVFRNSLSPLPNEGLVQPISALYGLARVAYAKGSIAEARQLAKEGRDSLFRLRIKHRLAKQIKDLLEQIEVEATSSSEP